MAGLMFFKDVTEQQAVATVTNSARQKAALLRPLSKVTNSTVEQWAAWNLIIVDRVFFFYFTFQQCKFVWPEQPHWMQSCFIFAQVPAQRVLQRVYQGTLNVKLK